MAGEQMCEKGSKILELFKNMSYDNETKDDALHLFKKWKNSRPPLRYLTIADLENLDPDKNERIEEPCQRTILIQKFASLITDSMELICQICANETLRKEDTRKGVQLLIDYLRFYATCTNVLGANDVTGGVLCIFEAYVYPGLLGMVLGATLARSGSVVIMVNNLVDLCDLLSELATKAGYPSGTITVLNVEKVTHEFGNWNKWKTVYHFGFDAISHSAYGNRVERLLNIQYGKTPMIVFDSADQQSACEVLIDAVWSYNGQLPWSVDTAFVQENIWDNFLTKLKSTIKQRSLDFETQNMKSKIDQMISDAEERGIEIYLGGNDNQLVVFIGQRTYETNVILSNKIAGPTLTVLPFRTLNEGIDLANNNRQGIAATVWGENINQVNEAARKLIVGTVWINSFGVLRPDVSFVPWKESGFGYFGGVDGLLEHDSKVSIGYQTIVSDLAKIKSVHSVATSAQKEWLANGFASRSNIFLILIKILNLHKPRFKDWISIIYKSLTTLNISGQCSTKNFAHFDLKSIKSPIGIIAIENIDNIKGKEILVTSLLLGNVVCILESNEQVEPILMDLFPKGVINIIKDISHAISMADESNVMVIVKDDKVPVRYMQKCRHIDEKRLQLTQAKTIWISFGETYC